MSRKRFDSMAARLASSGFFDEGTAQEIRSGSMDFLVEVAVKAAGLAEKRDRAGLICLNDNIDRALDVGIDYGLAIILGRAAAHLAHGGEDVS